MQPDAIFGRIADALERDWRFIARPNQLPPPGEWSIWLLCAGRGYGKTRTGAEWVREQVESETAGRIALVAPTAGDARDVMVEGESGILAISSAWCRPIWESSKRRLTWPNGAIATHYSADEPERLRGPQHDAAWCDEIGSWRYPEAWDQMTFGLRLGKRPRAVVTTTPRPTKLIMGLFAREGQDVVVTRGRTSENAANLAPSFLERIVGRYSGTRLGRQELDGELLSESPGALWTRARIEDLRIRPADLPQLARIVVAIDSAVTSGEDADETGIVAAGRSADGHAYVLEDGSLIGKPNEWAKQAIAMYLARKADRVVAEVNNGGEMVENTLRMVDPAVAFRSVHASRGKVTRAEPISALYEQGRVHHVGAFPQLEDQLCAFTSDFDRATAGYSPDRLDALVWALTELMVTGEPGWGILEWYRQEAERAGLAAGTAAAIASGTAPIAGAPGAIALQAPAGAIVGTVYTITGRKLDPDARGVVHVTRDEATPLKQIGWTEIETPVGAVAPAAA